MSCVFIVLKYVLEVVACTAPRFWHRKCRYPRTRIRGFMPIPQVPQFPMYGFICIFIGPKYIPTYHPHTSNPQGPSQPRMYTPNPQCPLSAKCDRGSQLGWLWLWLACFCFGLWAFKFSHKIERGSKHTRNPREISVFNIR